MSLKKQQAIDDITILIHDFSNQILKQLDQLEKLIDCCTEITDEQLEELRKREKEFDQLEIKVSEQIISTIVLHQPMASDLRLLISCYRISINLERIGDLVMNIVNFILRMKDKSVLKTLPGVIDEMLSSSINMVRKAVLSFVNQDKDYALWTLRIDSEIDEFNQKLIKKTLSKTDMDKENRRMLMAFIRMNGIISNIERIADHATNIAESSIYSIEGTDLRHQKLPGEENQDK